MNLEAHIWELLLENECVIVPNFGAFVANVKASEYQALNQKIYPPSKSISFNNKLQQNDALLANRLCQLQGYSYDDALAFIHSEVARWKAILAQGQKIKFEFLGTIFIDDNQALRFDPNRTRNLLLDSYGLNPVKLSKLEVEISERAPEPPKSVERQNRITATESKRPYYRVPKLMYLLLSFPFLLYLLWLSTQTNIFRQEKFIISDLNPFSSKICATYEFRNSSPSIVSVPELEESKIEALLNKEANYSFAGVSFERSEIYPNEKRGFFVRLKSKTPRISTEVKLQLNTSGVLKYHLISGCFSEKSNAERMVRKMTAFGLNASIIDQRRGLYRVSAASFARKEEALANLSSVRENYADGAWLLIK